MITVAAAQPDHFFIQLALGALGLILGWAIVHRLAVLRDMDKERRSLISAEAAAFILIINQLLIDARKYHTEARNEDAERSIKIAIQDLAERVGALRGIAKHEPESRVAQSTIRALRMAITGKHFEDEHSGPLKDPNPILENIAETALRTKRALLSLQYTQYK